MNQSVLLNNDLSFKLTLNAWTITGFYQSQPIEVRIPETTLASTTEVTDGVIFDIEADIEEWLEENEPDESNIIQL